MQRRADPAGPVMAPVATALEREPVALPDAGADVPGSGTPLTVVRRASPSLANVTTGLDFGSYEMKLVQVAQSRYGPVVVGFNSARTPPGAVSDGRIMDARAVSRTLRVLLQDARVRPKSVITCATGKAVTLRVLPFPHMRPEELVRVLSRHGEQYVPFAREKAAFAFSILEGYDRSAQMEVLVAATSKEVPDMMERALRAARLRMTALDVDALAAFRGLRMAGCVDHASRSNLVVLLDFGASAARICLFWRKVPRLVRSVPVGGHALTAVIADELGLSEERAERDKRAYGLTAGSTARAVLMPEIDRLVGELRQAIEWFLAQKPSAGPGALYLLGGGAALYGLAPVIRDYLSGQLEGSLAGANGFHVTVGASGGRIAVDPHLADRSGEFGPQYVTALGLALRG